MCSSMKTCKRRCRSFTLLLNEKFMSAACLLFTRESSGTLLHKVRDTLFEILRAETRHHLAHGNVESFRQRLRHGLVYLALDYAQRARAHRWNPVPGQTPGLFRERFPGEKLDSPTPCAALRRDRWSGQKTAGRARLQF